MELPPVVSASEWNAALAGQIVAEKEHMKAGDALAARRRRLPRLKVEKDYRFETEEGPASLADLFQGRRQLVIYHFMFGPDDEEGCTGCSMVVDNMGHRAHLEARDVTRVLVSRAPLAKLVAYKKRLSWTERWVSSHGTDFNADFGVTSPDGEENFGLSALLREGEAIYRTYFTSDRGGEALGTNWSYLDRAPFGRQETWEDSPDGYPQSEPYQWWRRHDRY